MTYIETVTSNGETVTGTLSNAGALSTLRRGLRLGSVVTATKDGTITIVRTALRLNGEDVTESKTVVTLRPVSKQSCLTQAQYNDLIWIRSIGERAHLLDNGRIGDAFCQIGQSAAKRLLDRGFAVVTTSEGRVEVSVAGMLAMAAYEHPARTTRPRGWYSPAGHAQINTPRVQRMHPYQTNDRTSAAVCRCGFHRTLDERIYAVAAKNGHLSEVLSAALASA